MSAGLEIHDAASTGDLDSLEEYLRSGKFDVNLRDEEWSNRTALHWACAKGYVECIRLLLDCGAVGTARSDTGWTPAHFAAETGKLTALRALYSANVPLGLTDKYGDTPKRVAEIYGFTECVKFFDHALEEQREKGINNDAPFVPEAERET
ncbi:ankyrin repeat domain-containing protein 66-like isoform X2 [Mya arenaria]|uniref:ankyrin repeat domain-containing protein 66-like isoform X2 n=1 Tax=Mya arenaria TaxID=6604 RepID=UPI0022E6FAEA|nr:ankyrin repeat domain-containing protein 66-like isoform X2 [Mya arenaria]